MSEKNNFVKSQFKELDNIIELAKKRLNDDIKKISHPKGTVFYVNAFYKLFSTELVSLNSALTSKRGEILKKLKEMDLTDESTRVIEYADGLARKFVDEYK